jgi:tripartite-type tricarboxylate transporter receptor subunit TctC
MQRIITAAVCAACLVAALPAQAQGTYPVKPIRVIVAQEVGSAGDNGSAPI